jgi:AcrR family transcriptional regulator
MAKRHDERRREIIATAGSLFSRLGYNQTSIQAIIDAVGIAKGTFYHYFHSKEELLDALTDQITTEAQERAEQALGQIAGGAVEKINALARITSQWKRENAALSRVMLEAIYSEHSLPLRHKLAEKAIARFGPIMRRVVEQGVREGSLRPMDPAYAGEAVLRWEAAVAGKVAELALALPDRPENATEIMAWLDISERGTERLLGMESGSLALYDREAVARRSASLAEIGGER